ncbi:hypothetical protein DPMN_112943 [Dreissena polymorpha]|uniref:Uncharacterized protein n=1 Tax=Dreissena polymorpha TaxID=45954 RepID=A0A9D4KGL1_DREPO|nr:hypothetical protein DPMN_112943 [Dreissena polymorpha]
MPRPPGGHVFQPIGIIFELLQDIIGMNLLTKFHEDRTINVASREKCAAPWQPCFSSKHWTINVASRVFTRKNAPPLGSHVFQANTNLLTKFHEDWTINVASRVLTRKTARPYINKTNVLTKFRDVWAKILTSRVFTRNTAPPPGGHVFQWTGTIFELNQHII